MKKIWKGDIEIGHRAHEEVLRLFKRSVDAERAIGMRHDNINSWLKGVCPSAKYLQKLHNAGADVIYILTGKRSNAS